MDKNKIEIKDLYLIFGSERNKAFKMLKKGKSKSFLGRLQSIFYWKVRHTGKSGKIIFVHM